jgi:hypothetical protein
MTVTSNMSTGSTVERKPIPASVAVREAPAEISSTVSTYCLDAARFQPKPEKKSRAEPDDVLIGFDTEYLVPETPVSNEDSGRVPPNIGWYPTSSIAFCRG